MKWGAPYWLFGTITAVVVGALLIAGAYALLAAVRRFGDEDRVRALVTVQAGPRRAIKAVLLVLAVALGFVALAQPQYGRGSRTIPRTNLDVVIVLDYSKSMYARDVKPSRTARAKAEVAQLVKELPGARFGAVAFAGESMSFPLTSDGAAIAQFFRQLSPNDMPVGGTAIARALETGRALLKRDPRSKNHKKVLLLITDGEDLQGNPVAVARAAAADDIAVHVVQIGGRTPEPIPKVNESGEIVGWRRDAQGKPLTTALSADGESQLSQLAELTKGSVVRSKAGTTGIQTITASLRTMMSEQLGEKVETVYADIFYYPAALALLLLLVEAFIGNAKRRKFEPPKPPPKKMKLKDKLRRQRRRRQAATTAAVLVPLSGLFFGCERTDTVFERYSPTVDEAIAHLEAGAPEKAALKLQKYLSTGTCEAGEIGTPEQLHKYPSAAFDLGLGLFKLGEKFGARFGKEPTEQELQATETEKRSEQVNCALRIVTVIAMDAKQPVKLRAQAAYLAGNLEFLRGQYEDAVKHYDDALRLMPGMADDKAEKLGRDAAYNRAIALWRSEQKPPPDAGPDSPPDAGNDAPDSGQPDSGDGGQDSGADGDNGDSGDQKPDGGDQNADGGDNKPDGGSPKDAGGGDAQRDAGGKPDDNQDQPKDQPQEQQPEPSTASQDERMLDALERAETVQQKNAKDRALQGRYRNMEDK